MKKVICALLAAALVCLALPGCEEKAPEKLRICFDMGSPYDAYQSRSEQEEAAEKALDWLDSCLQDMDYGVSSEDVELELIPCSMEAATERETALQRVRTEIMTGGGPDLYLCATSGDVHGWSEIDEAPDGDRLFPYVDQAMEEGFFLPLDDYMERSVLTNWDDMHQAVMDGGKNSKGEQVVLPMTFTLPIAIFYEREVPKIDCQGLTWGDVLAGNDPLLDRLADWPFWQTNTASEKHPWNGEPASFHVSGLSCISPELADYQAGELAFSEEELLSRVKKSIAVCREAEKREKTVQSSSVFFNTGFSSSGFGGASGPSGFTWGEQDVSLLPLPSEAGGSTALVSLWCAVNANTKRPGDAFAVADALCCETFQKTGRLYYINGGMPVNKVIGTKEKRRFWSPETTPHTLTDQQHEEWLRACETITAVRYPSALDAELSLMMEEIQKEMLLSIGPELEQEWYLCQSPLFLEGDISDERLAEIVGAHYKKMERLLDES